LKRAVLVSLALLITGPAAAGELESPAVKLSDVNWETAAASLPDRGTQPPADTVRGLGPQVHGLPIWKPPYGRITAFNLNTGDEVWMAARSGGYHYKYSSNVWLSTKGEGEFFANLSANASQQAGLPLVFRA